MKKKFLALYGFIFMSHVAFGVQSENGQDILNKIIYKNFQDLMTAFDAGTQEKVTLGWNVIFALIDRYKINPATFTCVANEAWGPTSLLELAIRVNCYRGEGGKNAYNREAVAAIKLLLTKYHVFNGGACGNDDCDRLFDIALENGKWGMTTGYPNLDAVDILLKHGATPSKRVMDEIETAKREEAGE